MNSKKQTNRSMLRRMTAAVVALMLGLCPVLAQAAAFTPGDMLPTLLEENVAAGREIRMKITGSAIYDAEMYKALMTPEDVELDEIVEEIVMNELKMVEQLLSASELELRYYDDFGTPCVTEIFRMSDKEIFRIDGRIAEDGMTILPSFMPGKALFISRELIDELNAGTDMTQGPAVQALIDYMPMAYITYFYRLGGWVSNTQMYREDLYVSEDAETPATDARDEVSQAMHYRVYTSDFLELLESVTFYFRDTDPDFKQHIADALAELGVTRGQLRKVFDTLFTREDLNGPDHWITRTEYLDEDELNAPVEFSDIHYAATRMAFSVKTCQEEMIEGVTDFVVSEGTDYQTVGFDGTMPQMWKDFPFENGAFTFNRKTVENEGVHYTAQGHMDLIQTGYAVDGDLDFYRAQRKEDTYTHAYDIGMDFVRESDKFGFDANVTDRLYLEGEADMRDLDAALSIYKDDTVYTLTGEIDMNTTENAGDFINETTLRVALPEVLEISVKLEAESTDYEEPAAPETVYNVATMTDEEWEALQPELVAGISKMGFTLLSAVPHDVMTGMMQMQNRIMETIPEDALLAGE